MKRIVQMIDEFDRMKIQLVIKMNLKDCPELDLKEWL